MPKNRIQFQKVFSFVQFQQCFASKEQCWQALFRIKFPQGFRCHNFDCRRYYRIRHRQGLLCTSCKKQLVIITIDAPPRRELSYSMVIAAKDH